MGILRIEGVEIRVDCRNRSLTLVDIESGHRNVVLVKQFLERIDSNRLNRTPFNNLRARLRAVGSIYNLVGRHCRIVDCKSQHHIATVLALSVGLCHSGRGNSHLARHRRRQRDVALQILTLHIYRFRICQALVHLSEINRHIGDCDFRSLHSISLGWSEYLIPCRRHTHLIDYGDRSFCHRRRTLSQLDAAHVGKRLRTLFLRHNRSRRLSVALCRVHP